MVNISLYDVFFALIIVYSRLNPYQTATCWYITYDCFSSSLLYAMNNIFGTVLLVDDDEITNFINEEILTGMAITPHVHILKDGIEALDYINRQWVKETSDAVKKLLLLDINMSNMDGFELLQKMPLIPGLSVVILTTSQHKRDKELAKKHKVLAYIEKPLTRQKLVKLFSQIIP